MEFDGHICYLQDIKDRYILFLRPILLFWDVHEEEHFVVKNNWDVPINIIVIQLQEIIIVIVIILLIKLSVIFIVRNIGSEHCSVNLCTVSVLCWLRLRLPEVPLSLCSSL